MTSAALVGGGLLSVQPFLASAAPAGPVVSDSFARNVQSGLGSAAVGGAYAVRSGNTNPFSVDGHSGRISAVPAGKSVEAYLPSTSLLSGEVKSGFAITTPLNSGKVSLYHGVELRRQSDGSAYRAKLHVAADGTTSVDISRTKGSAETILGVKTLPTRVGSGASLVVDAAIAYTSPVRVVMRAYVAGAAVSGWQLSVDDSSAARLTGPGAVGFWDYADTSSPAVAVRLDSLTATLAAGSTPPPTTTTRTSTTTTKTTTTTTTTTTTAPPPSGPTGTLPGWIAPSVPKPRLSGTGSAAPGSTAYAVPAGATFVSPSGSDANSGTQGSPKRTVAAAVATASSGGTIVLRSGLYHESVSIPANKRLTIQAYPHEVVWFDGSTTVTGWAKSGSAWAVGNWTTKFDSSPTYTRGGKDGTTVGWQFINPAYPMAAHPDQVFIDGAPQKQVSSLSQVRAGSFYVDYGANRLYLGSDPSGHKVYASTLVRAFAINSAGTVLRGFGITRYSPSVPDMGAVAISGSSNTLENVVIADSATSGLDLSGASDSMRNVTLTGNGQIGFQATYADSLNAFGVFSANNNTEHFNPAPAAGGAKIARTRDVTVQASEFDSNDGSGLWFDESSYNMKISHSAFIGNQRYGIDIEISGTPTIANNYIADNVSAGVRLTDASNVTVWNNTIVDNNRALDIQSDSRRASQRGTPGHDPRRPIPDPTVPWVWGPMSISNNIFETSTGNTIVGFEDHTHALGASASGIKINGNVYQRTSGSAPGWVDVWARPGTDPAVYSSLSAFSAATGQERNSSELAHGANAVSSNGSPSSAVSGLVGSVAQAATSTVAGVIGFATGTRSLGSTVRLG